MLIFYLKRNILYRNAFLYQHYFSTQTNPNVSFKKIQKVLVANRGEISCRIMRTARQLGIETVAVFSDADRNSMHVSMADEAYHIGKSPATNSYLVKEKLIEVAQKSNSDAIHPGYGFLSENFEFAKLCSDNNIIFVGPTAESIKAMGIKSLSKSIMINAGVPVIPGFHDDKQQDSNALFEQAKIIGFPLMIKAVRGGGGKGMRIALHEAEFFEQLDSARREAMKAFGDDVVLLEKFVSRPRHIEVQIFGDKHGNCVHLFERDCSSQRRHQKVIEEAPAPNITPEVRHELGTAAVKAALAVNYHGAGTVEFIFDTRDKKFYFMEMNTRLQVEHPVTEMVTGLDLVEWQLRIASGEPLPKTQEYFIHPNGHAFEARIYAEDADANFAPCTGLIETLSLPQSNQDSIRIETGVRLGDEVSVFYDPMIAKLVVWAPDRSAALQKLCQALREFHISGFKTNLDYLLRLALHPKFQSGDVYTDFIAEHQEDLKRPKIDSNHHLNIIKSVATLAFMLRESKKQKETFQARGNDFKSPFNIIDGPWMMGCNDIYSSIHTFNLKNTFGMEDTKCDTCIKVKHKSNSRYLVMVYDNDEKLMESMDVLVELSNEHLNLFFVEEGIRKTFRFSINEQRTVTVYDHNYGAFSFELELPNFLRNFQSQSDNVKFDSNNIVSPMPGVIEKISVKPGDIVRNGDAVVILTAMKMEHIIHARFEDENEQRKVGQVLFKPGDSVAKNSIIVKLED